MKAKAFFLILSFLFLTSVDLRLIAAEPITLQSAVQSGLASSPAAREALSQVRRAAAERNVALSALLPQIEIEASTGAAFRERLIDGSSLGTGRNQFAQSAQTMLEQLLFDWGATTRMVKSAALRQKVADQMTLDAQNRIGLAIAETYVGILQSREQIAELQRLERDLMDKKSKAEASSGKTSGGKQQVVLIESRIIDAKTNRIQAAGNLRTLEARFRILTALEPTVLVGLPDFRLPSLEDARLSSPLLVANRFALDASKVSVEAAQRGRLPKFYADVNFGVGQNVGGVSGPDNYYSALAVGRWTPVSGGRNLALVEQARADVDRDTAALEASDDLLEDALELAQATISAEKQRMSSMNGLVSELQESLRDVEDSARTGGASPAEKTNWLTVAQTHAELSRARIGVIGARYGQKLAAYRALSSSGALCPALGIDGIVEPSTGPSAPSEEIGSAVEKAALEVTEPVSVKGQTSSGIGSLIAKARTEAQVREQTASPTPPKAIPDPQLGTGSAPTSDDRKSPFSFKLAKSRLESQPAGDEPVSGADLKAPQPAATSVPAPPPVPTAPAAADVARVEALPVSAESPVPSSKDRLPLGQRAYLFQKTAEQAAADQAAAQDPTPTGRVPLAERRFLFDRERKVAPPSGEASVGS
jgi:outer membrane protein TolC